MAEQRRGRVTQLAVKWVVGVVSVVVVVVAAVVALCVVVAVAVTGGTAAPGTGDRVVHVADLSGAVFIHAFAIFTTTMMMTLPRPAPTTTTTTTTTTSTPALLLAAPLRHLDALRRDLLGAEQRALQRHVQPADDLHDVLLRALQMRDVVERQVQHGHVPGGPPRLERVRRIDDEPPQEEGRGLDDDEEPMLLELGHLVVRRGEQRKVRACDLHGPEEQLI